MSRKSFQETLLVPVHTVERVNYKSVIYGRFRLVLEKVPEDKFNEQDHPSPMVAMSIFHTVFLEYRRRR